MRGSPRGVLSAGRYAGPCEAAADVRTGGFTHRTDDSSDFSAPSWYAEELNTVRRKRLARRANCFTEPVSGGESATSNRPRREWWAARLAYRQFRLALDPLDCDRRARDEQAPRFEVETVD
jgi:hypothetical protein